MRLPDFLCIGAQKSATTWFYTMLRQHPSLWLSPLRELHYFDRYDQARRETRWRHEALQQKFRELPPEGADKDAWAAYMDAVAAHPEVTLEWYRQVFSWPVADSVKLGDVTPAYMEVSESAVAHARELLGDIKIMAIVRRPLDREMSQLRMWRTKADSGVPEPQDDAGWMQLYEAMLKEQTRGAYSIGIPTWLRHFSEEKFLALPFGDVESRPLKFMNKVQDFLEIPRFGEYGKLRRKIHKSQEADIPESVVARAAERVSREDEFLKSFFGQDFYNRT